MVLSIYEQGTIILELHNLNIVYSNIYTVQSTI